MELKKTPLYSKHIEARARMVDFFGWSLPIEYESIIKETAAVRTTCGLFDASHMGQIEVSGKNRLEFLQGILSNDLSLIKEGRLQYNLLLNDNGTVVDDLMVYNLGESFFCVVNASNIDKDYRYITENRMSNVSLMNRSDGIALISLQGPHALYIMREIFRESISSLKYMHFVNTVVEGIDILVSRSGYTGEDGFELFMDSSFAVSIFDMLVYSGKGFDLRLCGLGARDILRLEAGYPLYGHELNDKITPFDAGLGWAVKFNKGLTMEDTLIKAKESFNKKRIGFVLEERGVPRQGQGIYYGDSLIGIVTSGNYSPNADKFMGMGYIDRDFYTLSLKINIKIRNRFCAAKIVKFPFVEPRTINKKQKVIG